MRFYKVSESGIPRDDEVLFVEVQRFTQLWLWLLLVVFLVVEVGIFGYGVVKQIVFREPWGDRPVSDAGLFVVAVCAIVIPLVVMYLFSVISFEVRVCPNGLYMRYFPFHLRYRFIPWEEIGEVIGRKYKPVGEYGGWGIRWNLNSWAYTVSGNYCIELRKGKKKVVIGTQRLREFLSAIKRAQEIYLESKCDSN